MYHRYMVRCGVLYNCSCIVLSSREYKHMMRNVQCWSKIRTLVYEQNFLWLGLWIDLGLWLRFGVRIKLQFSIKVSIWVMVIL
jgi:hypothetical protein